jgi:bifunctional non-homologous end joining protein LigD
MTPHLDLLAELPVRGVFDGELVAFGADGKADFVNVCERLLHGRDEIPLTFVIFDLLTLDGVDLRRKPYRERRHILDGLGLAGPSWYVAETFEDGEGLWSAVCEHELEGVVAKRLDEPYTPRKRAWVKVKNRSYWRYELERERAIQSRRDRTFVLGAKGRPAVSRVSAQRRSR